MILVPLAQFGWAVPLLLASTVIGSAVVVARKQGFRAVIVSADDRGLAVADQLQRAGTSVVERTARPQDLGFFNIVERHAEPAAVAQGLANRLRPVMKVDNYFIATVASEIFSNVADKWFPQDWNRRLGAVFC